MVTLRSGRTITHSDQVVAGVIQGSDIAADAITKDKIGADQVEASEIATGAVGTAEVANDSLINEDIKSDAAIADTKLATISTAGKVSGAALTLLANIPAGAGTIPAANLPAAAPSVKAVTVSDDVITAADTARLTGQLAAYAKQKEIIALGRGIYRVKFSMRRTGSVGNQVYGRIYLDGSGVGGEHGSSTTVLTEYTDDMLVSPGQKIQLYAWNGNQTPANTDCEVSLFKVCGVETTYSGTQVITD